jgi:hypothetical protein
MIPTNPQKAKDPPKDLWLSDFRTADLPGIQAVANSLGKKRLSAP